MRFFCKEVPHGKESSDYLFFCYGKYGGYGRSCSYWCKKAGGKVLLAPVADVDPNVIGKEYDYILLGCSAWGIEIIEEEQMRPFCEELKPYLKGKIMGIFGSCGWSRGAWLNSWYNELHFAGALFPAPPVLAYGYPDEEGQINCENLGNMVVSAAISHE